MRGYAWASRFGVRLSMVAGAACALGVGAGGCVKRGKGGVTKADMEVVKDHILNDMPADVPHKVDVNFEDKVHLVGWKADPETAAPGSTVHLTLYWKKVGDLDPGWKLFTHVTSDNVRDAKGNLDCTGAIRTEKQEGCRAQIYGPSDWEKGKVISDTFDYTVPNDVTWASYRFLVGVWKDDARLRIVNADANDGDNRANVVVVPTGVKPPENAPAKTELPRLDGPKFGKNEIKIDGKLDEPAWQKAGTTGPFVSPGDGKTPPDHPVDAAAKVGWDDANLYVAFVVNDKDPKSPFKASDKDPHIWEKSSAVELMIQPGDPGDNRDYYELQVDVNGAVFDTHWDDYNQPITGGPDDATKVFGHMDWASGLKQAVVVDKELGHYTAEIAIPWSSFQKARVLVPPKPGDTWRVNFYSFKDGQRQALAWSPIMGEGNFHKASRFGRVTFANADGSKPEPPPSGGKAEASASASAGGSAASVHAAAAPSASASNRVVRPSLQIQAPIKGPQLGH